MDKGVKYRHPRITSGAERAERRTQMTTPPKAEGFPRPRAESVGARWTVVAALAAMLAVAGFVGAPYVAAVFLTVVLR